MSVVFSVEGLEKSFGENHVLKGIDMTVSDGEVVSVIGSSVAGFTVTGFFDDGLANSGSFLKRSEFVFVVLLTPFSAWDMKNIQGGFRLWLTNEKIRHFRPLFLH